MRGTAARRRRQAGVTIIEFVFSVWPILLLVAWLMEYAMFQLDAFRVEDLAIATANAMADSRSTDDAAALAQALVSSSAPLEGLHNAAVENITWNGPVAYGTTYQVVVGATHSWLFLPFFTQLGPSYHLQAAAYGAISRRNVG